MRRKEPFRRRKISALDAERDGALADLVDRRRFSLSSEMTVEHLRQRELTCLQPPIGIPHRGEDELSRAHDY
jgi:hypothetical protein